MPQSVRKWLSSESAKKIKKSVLLYILLLFVASRTVYAIIGDESIRSFDDYVPRTTTAYTSRISPYIPIQMWYNWDAINYTNLARQYSGSLSQLQPSWDRSGKKGYYLLHWFPLYPLTSKAMSAVTGLSIPYSQLLISNVSFIAAMYFLYKLIRVDEGSNFARNVVTLFVLLPTSFLFSAALAGALFIALTIACLYCARKQRWIWAGVLGFLLALTRAEGILITIPLLFEAMQQYGFKKENLKAYIKPILACSITSLGLLLFMFYCWLRTKDPFAYVNSQYAETGLKIGDPFVFLYHYLFKFKTIVIIVESLAVMAVWKKLRWSYIAYTFVLMITYLSISSANAGIGSILRYVSVVFPVAIAAAYLASKKSVSPFLWMTLGILNGAFFVLWVNWWTKFII